jgi:[ribosomal protein S5]-alanine N-acetyltransferase
MIVTETPRLTLRRMNTKDTAFMVALLNEPSFIRNIGDRGVRTTADAESYITAGPLASYARFGFGLYVVELKTTESPIGICGLLKRDTLPMSTLASRSCRNSGRRAMRSSRRQR